MQTFVSDEKLLATKITVAGEDGKKVLFVYGLSEQQILSAISQAFGKNGAELGNGHLDKPVKRTRRTKAEIAAAQGVAA